MIEIKGIRGYARLEALRRHRLCEFEKAFDKLIEGRVPVEVVTKRRLKLKAVQKGKRGKL